MRDNDVKIVDVVAALRRYVLNGVRHGVHRELVDCVSVALEVLALGFRVEHGVPGFLALLRTVERAVGVVVYLAVKSLKLVAVSAKHGVERLVGLPVHHRAGSVSEQYAHGTVGVVKLTGQLLAGYDKYRFVMTALEILLRDIRRCDEAGACAVNVECGSVHRAYLLLDKARGGGIEEIRRAGGYQHQVDLLGLYSRVVQRLLRRLNAHVIAGLVGQDMALLDSRTWRYPFVRCVEELCELVVIGNEFRHIAARS